MKSFRLSVEEDSIEPEDQDYVHEYARDQENVTPKNQNHFGSRSKNLSKLASDSVEKVRKMYGPLGLSLLNSVQNSPEPFVAPSHDVVRPSVDLAEPSDRDKEESENDTVDESDEEEVEEKVASPLTRKSPRFPLPARTPEVMRAERRRRANKNTDTVVKDDSDSEYESSCEESDESEESTYDVDFKENEETDSRMMVDLDDIELPAVQESFFKTAKQSRKSTSDNTLSKLPVFGQAEYANAVKSLPVKHALEIQKLMNLWKSHFSQWTFELTQGFNLLFYGYGSKRDLLDEFATCRLVDAPLVTVNGFMPSITVKDITAQILSQVFGYSGVMGTVLQQIDRIQEMSATSRWSHLYLLIHNIDGINLRNEKSQAWLSRLAQIPQVRLIASIDHVHAPMLWDNVKLARMHWSWHDLTTFKPYLVETMFESTTLNRSNTMSGPHGILYVLKSLPDQARKVFMLLARHQIDEETVDSDIDFKKHESDSDSEQPLKSRKKSQSQTISEGLPFHVFFRMANESFLVNNELTFRTQLTEFRDHEIILSKRSADGEVLFIPHEKSVLEQVLACLESRQ